MSSTPLTSCSIGVATVSAMTSGGARGRRDRFLLCVDLDPGAHALEAGDDHPILRPDALADDAQAVDQRPDLHRAVLGLALTVDQEDELLRLVAPDRLVGDED